MKSQARDPFAVDPLPKAYYHPSPEKKLSRAQKTTSISPSRQSEDKNKSQQYENERVSPMDEIFLQGTNSFQPRQFHYESPDNEDFDETWPTSERPSSLSLTGLEEESPVNIGRFQATIDKFANIKQTLKFADQTEPDKIPQRSSKQGPIEATKGSKQEKQVRSKLPQKTEKLASEKKLSRGSAKVEKSAESDGKMTGSVLQRYIERFRNSAPMSREEREQQKQSSSQDFWWLSSGAAQGQPGRSAPDQEDQTYDSIPLTAENLNQYSQWEQRLKKPQGRHKYPESPNDKKTIELQERAEKLLEKREMDALFWSWIPGIPKGMKWVVRLVSWEEEPLQPLVFCHADEAYSSTVLSTDPAVSTEGLGSNMSDMSSLEEYPYRPAFTAVIDRDRKATRRDVGSRVPEFRPTVAHPDDDPLQQWRLRRRIDQAKTMPAKHTHKFDFLAKSEKDKMVDEQLEEFKRKLSGKAEPIQRVQMRSSHGEFTPAPNISQVNEAIHPTGNQGQQRSQIASPILHSNRPVSEPEREVDPHLHLVCDLLPCPHQEHSYRQVSHADQQYDLNHTENMDKFKQFLEAEKPDIDERIQQSHRNAKSAKSDMGQRKDHDSDNEVDRRRKSHRNKFRSDAELSDKEDNKRLSDNKAKTKVKYKDEESDDYDNNNHKNKTVRIQDSRDREEKQERKSTDRYEDRQDSDSVHRDSRDRRREKLPKPRESSSPKPERRGLDQAIGQVVKNHLFSMSTSTVLSSVESLPPVSSVEGLPPYSRPPLSSLPEHSETHADESDHSDGEFSEDNLLQMLRRQRSVYEQQLQEIDEVLENLESR